MRKVELGIFMPVGSNGFLMSKAAPRYHPTFELHSAIAGIAEEIGLDYLFSMGKWMGFGGDSHFWENTIEPITMASAVAGVTSRIKLFSTINPLLFHPAVAAKIIATLDNISGGRFGINIVTGNTLEEIEQMGLVPEGYGDYRYDYADEWIAVMKMLWSEPRTTFHGRFFHLDNCVSDPKPLQKPYPAIVSAGLSDEGLSFGARHSDYQFVGNNGAEVLKVKSYAEKLGRTLRASGNVMIIAWPTQAEAQARFDVLRDGRDDAAFENLINSFERDNRESYGARTAYLRNPDMIGFGNGMPVIGTPDRIVEKLLALYLEAGMDALQMTFIDYVGDLKAFGAEIYPKLKSALAEKGVALGA
jgi:pyrimidine oxygenase